MRGEQWDAVVVAKLRNNRRPGMTINKVLGTLSSILGEQIDLRTEVAFRARYGASSDNADTLTKTFRYISDKNQLNWLRSEMFADGAITSRGYVDIRMNYDRSVTGDVVVSNVNPKNVIPDPDAHDYDPDKWNDVIETKWMNCDEIEYFYSAADAELLRHRADGNWQMGYDSIEQWRDRFGGDTPQLIETDDQKHIARIIRTIDRQYRKLAKIKYFVDVRTGTRKDIPDSWDRNKIALAVEQNQGRIVVDEHVGTRIRWTVTADDLVLYDDWSPYKHFTLVPYFPYFRHGKTIGLVENLLDPQDLLNKSISQELHVINTTANSGWKVKRGALANMTPDELEEYGAASGLVLEVDGNPDTDIIKIQPNQIPQGLDHLSTKGEGFIKTVSMRGDAQTGMTRADVSADQIEANNVRSDVGLRKPMDNLLRTDYFIARNVVDLVQEFYTDPRIMLITNSEMSGEQSEIRINWPDPEKGELINDVSVGDFEVVVISQPVKQTLEETQFSQAPMMKEKLGIQIPDEFLIKNSNVVDKTALLAALKAQAESPQAQLAAQVQELTAKLQVADLKAQVSDKESASLLKRSKAAHAVAQTQELTNGDPTGQGELDLKAQAQQQEMALDKQQHDQKMQMQREEHMQKMQLKEKESADNRMLARAQGLLAIKQAKAQPTKGATPA